MAIKPRSLIAMVAGAAVAALVAAACSPASTESDRDGGSASPTTVTFRLWDAQVAKAYEQSFAKFEQKHKDIRVDVEVVPWADYWTKLPQDVSSGDMADVFWTNSANFVTYANGGRLLEIDKRFGNSPSGWKESVVDQYTWKGKLWGVPQLWDSIALFYNKDMVESANVDPASLTWDPNGGGADTFLPAARRLTIDSSGKTAGQAGFDATKVQRYGFDAAFDLQAIVLDFVGSNGGQWQQGERYALDSAETAAAVQYVVDLINRHHVSPSAADTNENGDKTRDLFVQGKLALYQSGPYRLKDIQESADFEWAVAPMLKGPAGRVSAVNGVIAAGYSRTPNQEQTVEVLKWLGSADGQLPIAEGGYAFPGVVDAESAYVRYWSDQGVDVRPFIDAANGDVIYPPTGSRAQAGMTATQSPLQEVFLGRKPVREGLAEAQQAGNDAMSG